MNARTEDCSHQWVESYPDDGLVCHYCEATPAEVLAATGEVELPCEHVVTDPATLSAHINSTWIGEGALRSCELDMPGWADE